MRNKYWYGMVSLICGLHIQQYYAGGNNVKEKREDEEKKVIVVKCNVQKECFWCKKEQKETTNPLWSFCQKNKWLHNQCKIGSFFNMTFSIPNFFARDKYGVIPLSKAVFRGRIEGEKENSCRIVETILHYVGKDALNMLLLCDHYACSAWMHTIYMGDPEMVQAIVSAIKKQVNDPDAVWKLLTNQSSGGYGYRKLTALMVAVKRKNIELIKLLKHCAGERFNEYLLMKGAWGETASSFADNNDTILNLLFF